MSAHRVPMMLSWALFSLCSLLLSPVCSLARQTSRATACSEPFHGGEGGWDYDSGFRCTARLYPAQHAHPGG